MKIALVHDYIKEYGGAERVLESLHEIYPEAPVFTLVYLPQFLGPHKERFKDWDIRTSFLQDIPLKEKLISPMRLIAPFLFKSLDLSNYDVVIVSATGAYSPNLINKKRAIHICYYHTPPRYLYGFATAREWKKNVIFKILGETANHFLRIIDYKSSQNVDFAIANSENIKKRIQKFYRMDSVVVYPPVSAEAKGKKNVYEQSKYYLCGGRLARPKHIDLIVKTFSSLDLPLKVFGKEFAGYGEELRAMAGSNVEFLGEISDTQKLMLMENAKAYIFAAEDEDFGITPVEAMMMGTPVIAYKSGGVVETVIDEKTGLFFSKLDMANLKKAILKLDKVDWKKDEIRKHAQRFSEARFKKEIRKIVNSL